MILRTRFAPSPTGPLHLGHAFSAIKAFELARQSRGQFLLRIEDIDQSRARVHWETQIFSDLTWLGLTWEEPVLRQSEQQARYDAALDRLWADGLLYPCDCKRRDIQAALSAPQEGVALGPDGIIYPGTCRQNPRPKQRPADVNLRLDMAAATANMNELTFTEHSFGTNCPRNIKVNPKELCATVGDVVLSRRDMATSYHLSVVLDDAMQGITDVVRGEDLFDATQIHIVLQSIMGLETPQYHHHRLVRDEAGKRLAKRDDARSISLYRTEGLSLADIRTRVGLD